MRKQCVTLSWLKELICNGDTSPFYETKQWGKLRAYKRRLAHNECERCKRKGIIRKGSNVHHKKYLKDYPELALDINNLECLCDECHYEEHHKREAINEERW